MTLGFNTNIPTYYIIIITILQWKIESLDFFQIFVVFVSGQWLQVLSVMFSIDIHRYGERYDYYYIESFDRPPVSVQRYRKLSPGDHQIVGIYLSSL